ncbi:MAG: hypothetical protein H7X77_08025 [Anaerolineae bacterium]|nr:hypothetical protein [Anaerolineae bacterium]
MAKQQVKKPTKQLSTPPETKMTEPEVHEPQTDRAVIWILGLPRVVRMILIVFPAMATTIIFTQVVDMIYLRFFFTMETRQVPSLITSGLALVVYMIGWMLVVGTRGEKPQERSAVKWYLIASIILILFAFLWLMYLVFENIRVNV